MNTPTNAASKSEQELRNLCEELDKTSHPRMTDGGFPSANPLLDDIAGQYRTEGWNEAIERCAQVADRWQANAVASDIRKLKVAQ